MKEFGSFYKTIDHRKFNTWCKYTKRLDTYGCGCQYNCHYCYARGLLGFRGLWNINDIRIAQMYKIHDAIRKIKPYTIVKLGGMTDCFQPCELTYKNTYNTIKLLNKYKIEYLIVTKSDLVANEEYIKIYDSDLAHFQITITNTNDNGCIKYENAPVTSRRIKAIEKLSSLGFDVSIRLSPFVYDFIDFKLLNNINCDKILVEFLKANKFIQKAFNIDYSKYSLSNGNYYHVPIEEQIKQINPILGFKELSVGASVYDHYMYYKNNINPNKNDCCNLTITPKKYNTQLDFFKKYSYNNVEI